jgi:hypothetical protein
MCKANRVVRCEDCGVEGTYEAFYCEIGSFLCDGCAGGEGNDLRGAWAGPDDRNWGMTVADRQGCEAEVAVTLTRFEGLGGLRYAVELSVDEDSVESWSGSDRVAALAVWHRMVATGRREARRIRAS